MDVCSSLWLCSSSPVSTTLQSLTIDTPVGHYCRDTRHHVDTPGSLPESQWDACLAADTYSSLWRETLSGQMYIHLRENTHSYIHTQLYTTVQTCRNIDTHWPMGFLVVWEALKYLVFRLSVHLATSPIQSHKRHHNWMSLVYECDCLCVRMGVGRATHAVLDTNTSHGVKRSESGNLTFTIYALN